MSNFEYKGIIYKRLVFVCTANKYRSTALQYLLLEQDINFDVDSMGIMSNLPTERKTKFKKKESTNKELCGWADVIPNDNVSKKIKLHNSLKYSNDKNNLYVFVSDRHLEKYGNKMENCISVSEFVNIDGIEDPLKIVRKGDNPLNIWFDIEEIIFSIIKNIKYSI